MGPQEDYIETVLTCKGDFYDPEFHTQLEDFSRRLQDLLLKGAESQLILKKVEPWNSVRVTFNIPKDAAVRLRQLAQQGDRTLRDLGILAVQIEGDRLISLTLAGKNNECTELVFQTPATTPTTGSLFDVTSSDEMNIPGPSNVEATRKNIAQYLRDQGGAGSNLFESLFGQQAEFKSPHLVGREPPRTSGPAQFGSPSRSPIHSLHSTLTPNFGTLGLPSPSHSHSQGLPSPSPGPASPSYPTPPPSQPQLPGSPSTRSPQCPLPLPNMSQSGNSPLNNMQRLLPNKDITSASPLLVNLLQTDPAAVHLNSFMHQKMPPPGDVQLPPPKRKRRQRKNKDGSPKGKGEPGNGLASMFGLSSGEGRVPAVGLDILGNGPVHGGDSIAPASTMPGSLPAALQARLGMGGAAEALPGNRLSDVAKAGALSPAHSFHSSPEKIINPYTGQLEPIDGGDGDTEVPRSESTESLNSLDVPVQLQPPPNPLVALQNKLADNGQLLMKSSPHIENTSPSGRIPFTQPGRLSPVSSRMPMISRGGPHSPSQPTHADNPLPSSCASPTAVSCLSPAGCPPQPMASHARQAISRVGTDFMPRSIPASLSNAHHGLGPSAAPTFHPEHFLGGRSHAQVLSNMGGLPAGMRPAYTRLPPPYPYPSQQDSAQTPGTSASAGGMPKGMSLPQRLCTPHRLQNSGPSRLPSLINTLPHSTSIVESVAAKLTNVMSRMPESSTGLLQQDSADSKSNLSPQNSTDTNKSQSTCSTEGKVTPINSRPNSNNGHIDTSSHKDNTHLTKQTNRNERGSPLAVGSSHSGDMFHSDHPVKLENNASSCDHKPPVPEQDKCLPIKPENIKSENCDEPSDKMKSVSGFKGGGCSGEKPASVAFKLDMSSMPSPVASSGGMATMALQNDLHGLVRGSNGASTGEASPTSSDNASSASQPAAAQSPLPNHLGHALNHDSELSNHSEESTSLPHPNRTARSAAPTPIKDGTHAAEPKETEHKNIITVGYALSREANNGVPMDILGDKVLKSLGNLPYLTKPSKEFTTDTIKGVSLAEDLLSKKSIVKSPIIVKEVDARTQEVQDSCQEEEDLTKAHSMEQAYRKLTKCLNIPNKLLPYSQLQLSGQESSPFNATIDGSKDKLHASLNSTRLGPEWPHPHLTADLQVPSRTGSRGTSPLPQEGSNPAEGTENQCLKRVGGIGSVQRDASQLSQLLDGLAHMRGLHPLTKGALPSSMPHAVSPQARHVRSSTPNPPQADKSPSAALVSGRTSAPTLSFHPLQATSNSPRARPLRSFTPTLGLMEALSRAHAAQSISPGWPPLSAPNHTARAGSAHGSPQALLTSTAPLVPGSSHSSPPLHHLATSSPGQDPRSTGPPPAYRSTAASHLTVSSVQTCAMDRPHSVIANPVSAAPVLPNKASPACLAAAPSGHLKPFPVTAGSGTTLGAPPGTPSPNPTPWTPHPKEPHEHLHSAQAATTTHTLALSSSPVLSTIINNSDSHKNGAASNPAVASIPNIAQVQSPTNPVVPSTPSKAQTQNPSNPVVLSTSSKVQALGLPIPKALGVWKDIPPNCSPTPQIHALFPLVASENQRGCSANGPVGNHIPQSSVGPTVEETTSATPLTVPSNTTKSGHPLRFQDHPLLASRPSCQASGSSPLPTPLLASAAPQPNPYCVRPEVSSRALTIAMANHLSAASASAAMTSLAACVSAGGGVSSASGSPVAALHSQAASMANWLSVQVSSVVASLPQLVPAPSQASLSAVQPTWSCTAAAPSPCPSSVQEPVPAAPVPLKNHSPGHGSSANARAVHSVAHSQPASAAPTTVPTSSCSAHATTHATAERPSPSSKGISILQPMYDRDADVEAELDMIAKLENKTSPGAKLKDNVLKREDVVHRGLDTTMMTLIPHKGLRSTFTVAQLLDDSKAKRNSLKPSQVFNLPSKEGSSPLPTMCVKSPKGAGTKTGAGLKPQTVSALADFPRNSGTHLTNFMQKSIQTPPKLRNSAPHPITAPGFHLNLTESVQRVMSAIPCVDALSPPLDPPAVSLPSTHSPATTRPSPLPPSCSPSPKLSASSLEQSGSSGAGVHVNQTSPVSSSVTTERLQPPQYTPLPNSASGVSAETVVSGAGITACCSTDTKENICTQSSPPRTIKQDVEENCPSLSMEATEAKFVLSRVKSEERVDSGIETSSTGTPSSSETSSVASLHMQEALAQEEAALSQGTVKPEISPTQPTQVDMQKEEACKEDDVPKAEEPALRSARVTRRSSRSSTESRSGSSESLRSKDEAVNPGPRRRLRSDGSDMSTDTIDSGRGTRCSVSADRTSTPSPTPRPNRVSTRSARKRNSPELEETPAGARPLEGEGQAVVTRGSKRKLVLEEDSCSEKKVRPDESLRDSRLRKPAGKEIATVGPMEATLEDHNYTDGKRTRGTGVKRDEDQADPKKMAVKKASDRPAKSPSTEKEKPVSVGRSRTKVISDIKIVPKVNSDGKANATDVKGTEDTPAKRSTRSTRSKDSSDAAPVTPGLKRRRTSRDHR